MRPLSSRGKNWIWLPHKIRAESFERAPSSGGTCCSLLPPREKYVSLKRERERREKREREREREREKTGGKRDYKCWMYSLFLVDNHSSV